MNKLHAALIVLSRNLSKGLPKMKTITGDEAEYWKDVQRSVRRACIRSYMRFQHCRCPYPINDLRFLTWQNTTRRIAYRAVSRLLRNPNAQLVEEMTAELMGKTYYLPAAPKGKQLIMWEGEYQYV